VDVEVEYGLSGAGADVEDGAVSLLDVALAGDVGGGKVAAADDFCVGGLGLFESGKMFFGDDQDVSGGLRVDVFEGEDVVVVVDFFGGNFAAEDAAEEAVGIGHFLFTSRNDNIAARNCQANESGLSSWSGESFAGVYGTTEIVPFMVVPSYLVMSEQVKDKRRGRPRHTESIQSHKED
jgi:hypothetical protein